MKVCSNGLCHLTSMAAMPIYGKNLKNIFSGTKKPMTLKVGMQHRVLKYFQICSNDDPELTLTYFTTRSNLIPYAFVWEMGKTRTVRGSVRGSDYSPAIVLSEEKDISWTEN